MKTKKITIWTFIFIYLCLCIAVISFLHSFMTMDKSMDYLDWQSSVQINDDGSETPYSPDKYTNNASISGTYRFTSTLPDDLEEGYLLFETNGEELSMSLNDELFYQSSVLPKGTFNMSQAHVYLPEDAAGKELSITCTILDDTNAMFPPLLRFIPEGFSETEAYAYANLAGIPAGGYAFALLLIIGLFFLSIIYQKPEWSLIPLSLALTGLTVTKISQSLGYYFLSESSIRIFISSGLRLLTPIALIVYLLMNRQRRFWEYLGKAALCSFGMLLIGYVISSATGGYLSYYINLSVSSFFQSGFYDGLLYWFVVWLTLVCTLISIYWFARSFIRQRTEFQTLTLKNQLIADSYRAIRQKMRDSAELRHEFRHHLTALDALYHQGNYAELGQMLTDLKQTDAKIAQIQFTDNITVNAILQDAAFRASQAEIPFDTTVHLPEHLPVPEIDLCTLLMNMLDNALEACANVDEKDKRFIRFKSELKNGFLTVKCENRYSGTLSEDEDGKLLTSKPNSEAHGFGISQMSVIAEKYKSLLDVSYTADHIFTIQTALKMPQ